MCLCLCFNFPSLVFKKKKKSICCFVLFCFLLLWHCWKLHRRFSCQMWNVLQERQLLGICRARLWLTKCLSCCPGWTREPLAFLTSSCCLGPTGRWGHWPQWDQAWLCCHRCASLVSVHPAGHSGEMGCRWREQVKVTGLFSPLIGVKPEFGSALLFSFWMQLWGWILVSSSALVHILGHYYHPAHSYTAPFEVQMVRQSPGAGVK